MQFPDSRVFVRNFPDKVYNFSDAAPFDIGPNTCNTAVVPHFCLFYTAPVLDLRYWPFATEYALTFGFATKNLQFFN